MGGGLRAAAKEGVVGDGVGERGFGAGGRAEVLLREEVLEKE